MESSTIRIGARRALLLGLGAGAVGWLAASRKPDISEATAARRPRPVVGEIPNPVVYTHDGRKLRFYDDLLRDKVVAINMTYVGCNGICPATTGNLLRVQRMLGAHVGRDVFMYSITLQPELDTPKALKAYAAEVGVGPGWTFLTGAPADIEDLRWSLGFFDQNPAVDADLTNHAGAIRIGNLARDRWAMANGQGNPRQILATIKHVAGPALMAAA